jgi:hypothetical protein
MNSVQNYNALTFSTGVALEAHAILLDEARKYGFK